MLAVGDASKPFTVVPKLVCTFESPGQLKKKKTDSNVPSLKIVISGCVLGSGSFKIPGGILGQMALGPAGLEERKERLGKPSPASYLCLLLAV